MLRRTSILLALFLIILHLKLAISLASAQGIVAEIHRTPPSPCISKAPDDTTPGMKTFPDGITREDVRRIMVWMASTFVSSDKQYLTPKYIDTIDTVYSAVFYENDPINEIGIYGYRFRTPIQVDGFKAVPEFHGKLFVLNRELLILLWHKDIRRTERCFSAIEKILERYEKDPK
jgi:hypothetical protein